MATALAVIGIALAAFCVWLTVRIINRRERWAKWTLVVTVCLPVLYVLSIGPAVWIDQKGWLPRPIQDAVVAIHEPLIDVLFDGPDWARIPLNWYFDMWFDKKALTRNLKID